MKVFILLLAAVALCAQAAGNAEQINRDSRNETGHEKRTSTKTSQESKQSKSSSRSVSMNAALLRAYVDTFEISPSPETVRAVNNADSSGMLPACLENVKIISAPLESYPSFCTAKHGMCPWKEALRTWNGYVPISSPRYTTVFERAKPTVISCYLLTATFAHAVLKQAVENLELGAKSGSIEKIAREAIASVDLPKAFDMAFRIGSGASCLSPLQRVNVGNTAAEQFTWDCGQVVIDAQSRQFKIAGRPSLSEEWIDGRKSDVVVQDATGRTMASEDSFSKYSKGSSGSSAQWMEQFRPGGK